MLTSGGLKLPFVSAARFWCVMPRLFPVRVQIDDVDCAASLCSRSHVHFFRHSLLLLGVALEHKRSRQQEEAVHVAFSQGQIAARR